MPDRTIIAGILLTLPNIWLLTRALRKGQFYQRGPHARIVRRRQPVPVLVGHRSKRAGGPVRSGNAHLGHLAKTNITQRLLAFRLTRRRSDGAAATNPPRKIFRDGK